ncbi:disease resistance protein RPS2-like [Magnolia sinica]|uniref:disease resistance protein RPS2-like n=1 Tax=Magnolia sinica TaxID=86752 RepID=UPI00265B1EBD|nr:disease resistance protein RPS2-like [Magnolia sinica]
MSPSLSCSNARMRFNFGFEACQVGGEKLKDVAVLKRKGDSYKEVANKQLPDAVEEKPLTLAVGRDLVLEKVLSSKKFMLLLDDIWKWLDLDKVGIPHPSSQNMSKVIFTPRFEDVCGHMTADKKIKVECLPEQEAMNLFLRNVGEEAMKSHPETPILAKSVDKECKGLPLALITIGRAMSYKKTPQEWKHAISVLSTSKPPSEISGMNDKMLLRLKYSYDNLGGDTIKSCFLEGFLDGWDDDLDTVHNKGHDIIGRLKAACLLESGSDEEREVKLHDVIRDLALWIASECGKNKKRFLVRAGVGLTHAPDVERWKEAERISLMNNGIKEVTETPQCPNLLTLMPQWNRDFGKVHTDFFQFMPLLRVLDLSGNSFLKELPVGNGNLAELRYLNLLNTKIKVLPEEMGNLVKLKHLDLELTTRLHTIPQGAISRLSELTVMNLHYSYSEWEEGSEGLNMSELEGLERLNHLNITLSNVHALERLLCSSKLRNVTRYLLLNRCEDLTISNQLSSLFTAMKSLPELTFNRCNGLVEVMISVDAKKGNDYPVSSLEWLVLWQLPHLNCIQVGRGCFRNLLTIKIFSCFKLKKIYGLLQLESIEKIEIEQANELEEVIDTAIADGTLICSGPDAEQQLLH